MRLKKLELYGFKSFAQRTEIVFGEGITGIVGPNGSGKSNIGDAVRWVLGEQSAKTLRGASMSDVIFNGTQKRKPLSYCAVSLVFENDDRALNMDFAEVMVTRRVYRNGESEYYLNRAACRLKDIIDLFRDTGIGKEGYSIIGQGRIDEILSRRGEDRRQIFEEAAGIVKFKARKEEADKKLQRTLENAERVDDILEELNRQLKPLEEQARAAREYLELSAELKILDLNLFLVRSDRAKERLAELDGELMNLRTVLSDTEEALAIKTGKRDEYQAEIAQLEEKITGARSALMACAEQVHQAQSTLSALDSRRETRRENCERTEDENRESQRRLRELEEMFSRSESEARDQETLVLQAEQALREDRDAAENAEKRAEQCENELERHKADVMNALNRLSAVKNDQTRLKTMRAQMENRLEELTASEGALKQQEQNLQDAEQQTERRLKEEEALQSKLADNLADRQEALNRSDAALIALRTRAEQLSSSLQSTQSRHKLLSEMTREMEGYNNAVRRAVQYAKDRGISGVRGVLAQLISVPKAYETAIDMALGAAQQNIVTDNEETAKALIQYLRQNRLGRATFLPQTSVRSKLLNDRERQALRLPGAIGVASDLIRCASEYRGIVENLLGRTVIAENLDVGIPIMRAGNHAFRLVTLEGDVMHSGGSMTGGSAQSKMVNLLSRERELKELTESLRQGKVQLDEMKEKLAEGQQEKNALKLAVQDATGALHQQEIAVARETERHEAAKAELASHRSRMAQTAQASLQLMESMEDIDSQLDTISHLSGDAQLDQSAMEEKTSALQQALSDARAASSAAAERVMQSTLHLSDLRHQLDILHKDKTRYDQDRALLTGEIDRRRQQLDLMALQDAQDEAEQARTSALLEARQKDQQRQEQVAQLLENRRATAQEKLRDVLTDMESLHQSHTRDADRIHRTELSRARVESDLKVMQDRIWNSYEVTYAGAEEYRQTEGFDPVEADRRAAQLMSQIRALGSVNVNAVEEYAATRARFDELTSQQTDLRQAENDLRELIARLLEQMETTFVENFSKLQVYFSETFTRLFGGGHAELQLMDPSDPLNCGIEVNAQPPGKKLQLLSLLSGGERALTAIAILFAMLKLKPTPFCILDEIEAALDDANIGYYADYLKEYSSDTQFIVITHRKGTMERCNALYGVAMEEQGVSKMVSVSLQDYRE